jgi:CRP-like cAMP-binding protein
MYQHNKSQDTDCVSCPVYQESIFCKAKNELCFTIAEVSFKKGDMLFNEGQKSEGVYCIRKGEFLILKRNGKGENKMLAIAQPGELLGATSILISDENRYSTTAKAVSDGQGCFIRQDKFKILLQKDPGISMNLMQLILQKLNRLSA